MLKILKIALVAVIVFMLLQGINNVCRAHGGAKNMFKNIGDEIIITTRQMINHGAEEMQQEAQSYFEGLK